MEKAIGIIKGVRYLSDLFRRPIQASIGHSAHRPQWVHLLGPNGYKLWFKKTARDKGNPRGRAVPCRLALAHISQFQMEILPQRGGNAHMKARYKGSRHDARHKNLFIRAQFQRYIMIYINTTPSMHNTPTVKPSTVYCRRQNTNFSPQTRRTRTGQCGPVSLGEY